jgi:hypothetical protein
MTQHYRLAQLGVTVAALIASVSLGFWAGLMVPPAKGRGS